MKKRQLGKSGLVPYSPLGKGFLTGKMDGNTKFDSSDFRSTLPRFTPEALKANQVLVDLLGKIAQRKKAMPAQIALASDDLRDIENASARIKVQGARYPEKLEQMTGR
jgi:aryl-alcohol dehydrogenase-like predicted oxidoreductase